MHPECRRCSPTDLGRELFAESDLVIAAGAGLGHYTTEGGYLFPNAKVEGGRPNIFAASSIAGYSG